MHFISYYRFFRKQFGVATHSVPLQPKPNESAYLTLHMS